MSTQSPLSLPTDSFAAAENSRLFQRLHRRYQREMPLLPPGIPVRASMEHAYAGLQAQGHDVATALRILRQIVMERVLRLDCSQAASLADVMRTMTELAELALDTAYRHARAPPGRDRLPD